MKRYVGIIIAAMIVLTLIVGFSHTPFMGSGDANACGWGSSGGGDYAPQKRGPVLSYRGGTSLTKEQAYDVLSNHVKRLNPALEIGPIIDGGSFYEAEIRADNGEVVQRLAVDKESGRIIILN